MKVLVVEDNPRLAERIVYKLKGDFTVDSVDSGERALEWCQRTDYAVVVLDIGLPGISGLETCQSLRLLSNATPIIMLSGLNSVSKRVELLEAGADDYLTKPFEMSELRARIYALSRRRADRPLGDLLICGEIALDTERRYVERRGRSIDLRRKEFDILRYLIENQGRILTRQMIMNNVWNGESTSWMSTVDVHIKHLRDKIDRPFEAPYIKTIYGLGYSIDAKQ